MQLRIVKKPMPLLLNFVHLFSVLHNFQTKYQNFSRRRRNCTFLAFTNGTFKGLTNNMISMKNRRKPISQCSRSVTDTCLLLLFTQPLPRDEGMAEDHGAPEAEKLPRVWTRGCKETKSRQRVSGAKSL